jgi:hypothetical protein
VHSIKFYHFFRLYYFQLILFFLWKLLRSHHGVKQCFHTMDVAANNWVTAASPSAGPISAKSAIFIKNATILVAKHTKNLAKMGHGKARERSTWCFFFSLHSACLLLQHFRGSLKHTSSIATASRK